MKQEDQDQRRLTPDALLAAQAVEQEKLEAIEALTSAILEALEDKKGQDIQVLRVSEKTTLADVFILASGTSGIHVKTLADSVEETVKAGFDLQPGHIEGLENRNWVLLDYGDIIVHLMMPEDREHYKLENLWRPGGERQTI